MILGTRAGVGSAAAMAQPSSPSGRCYPFAPCAPRAAAANAAAPSLSRRRRPPARVNAGPIASSPQAPRAPSPEQVLEAKWGEGGAATPSSAGALPRGVTISSHTDGGNIDVLGGRLLPGAEREGGDDSGSNDDKNSSSSIVDVALAIHPDPYCASDGRSHFQWFHFRVTGARGVPLRLRVENAGGASFPEAWKGYQAMASYDLEHWFRVDETSYDSSKGELSVELTPERDHVALAYFAPYSLDACERMVARTANAPGVRLQVAGETLDGHDVAVLTFGGGEEEKEKEKTRTNKKTIWFVCRQHPGESQASFFAEGLAAALTDPHNPKARALLRGAVVHLAPNACPDGVFRGHLRTNGAGTNLNRAWKHQPGEMPDLETAPEAYCLTRLMDLDPPDLLIDVHGDEALPHVFYAGSEGVSIFNDAQNGSSLAQTQARLTEAMLSHLPDFQTEHGYEKDAPGEADMRILSNAASYRYKKLAVTLEMPFKRLKLSPGRMVAGGTAAMTGEEGAQEEVWEEWGPKRCARLGRDFVGVLLEMVPHL
jgi:murein tripeptide amidase MpaA